MRRYFLKDPDCNLIVQCQFNDALFIENAETNSHSYPEILSTDPAEQTPYPIWDTELAWDLDAEVLDILRVERASLKITCFAVNQKTREERSLGHIILDLAKAFEPDSAEEHWVALHSDDATAAGFRGLSPELKIAFAIDDGAVESTPTIDTLLTSIESVTATTPTTDEHVDIADVEVEEEDLELTPRIKNPVLQDMYHDQHRDQDIESHLNLDDHASHDDQDSMVPDQYYEQHRHSSLDSRVPSMQSRVQSMSIDIPVAVGETLIPADVVEQGFLQLGLGRDYFLFTITLQSVRNLDQLVERYAIQSGKNPIAVSQQLYLYYTFLGNHLATQHLIDHASSPIEETSLRLKSSMESMYQHFREDEQLVIHLCHKDSLLGTVTIPLAVILLHGTANLFHASPQFYPFDPADGLYSSESAPPEDSLIQVAMHITRDLNTLSVPSTPAVRRSSQGANSTSGGRRIPPPRPAAIEVDMARKIMSSSSTSSRSPKRHDYKFSIELHSFKSHIRHLNNVSLRYNYRPFGPKSTQPPINVKRGVEAALPEASRTFQLCQTPEALANQLQTPLVVEVWVEHPESRESVFYASGQIPLSDILKEPAAPSPEGGSLQVMESRFRVYSKGESVPTGEIQSSCSLEDQGEYVDSQQSEIFSTTPVHSMELEAKSFEQRYQQHRREQSQDQVQQQQMLLEEQLRSPRAVTQFAEGYSERDREMSHSYGSHHHHSHHHQSHQSHHKRNSSRHLSGAGGGSSSRVTSTGAQRPPSVRLSQVRHLSTAHQSSHSHSHHPYGKAASPSSKQQHQHQQQHYQQQQQSSSSLSNAGMPQVDYHQALKQQLAKQIEINKQIELDLLRRSPISNLPHTLHQTLSSSSAAARPGASRDGMRSPGVDEMMTAGAEEDEQQHPSRAIQKMKDLKGLDYQVQKQLVALEFRERKLQRAEEALQRQQAHFQKALERRQAEESSAKFSFLENQQQQQQQQQPHPLGSGPQSSSPNANDYFLLQDRFRALQRQNQLIEAEFSQYRQEHPAHINMTTINNLMATIQELESANAKLQNDVMFAKNYKEHYKALWTHSLQEIAAIRQDLQMGMEIKMMQATNEADQMRVLSSLGMHAPQQQQHYHHHSLAHDEVVAAAIPMMASGRGGMMRPHRGGDEASLLRGVKSELEMLQQQQKQMQQYQDDEEEDADMSWEQDRRHLPPHSRDGKDDDDSVVPSGGRGGRGNSGSPKGGNGAPSRQGSGHAEHDQRQHQSQRQSPKRGGGHQYQYHYSGDEVASSFQSSILSGSVGGGKKGYGGGHLDPEVLMEMMMASSGDVGSAKASSRTPSSKHHTRMQQQQQRPQLQTQRSGHSFLEGDDEDDDFDGQLEDDEDDEDDDRQDDSEGHARFGSAVPAAGRRPAAAAAGGAFGGRLHQQQAQQQLQQSYLQRYLVQRAAAANGGGRRMATGRSEDEAGDLDEDEQDDTLVDLGLLRHSVPLMPNASS
ncbi:hypothetical protein BGZ73_006075 [Actinomortierella ambigua]|nr:hypothetical protein BGZ73_006075 [Actinomortierella ambigua]